MLVSMRSLALALLFLHSCTVHAATYEDPSGDVVVSFGVPHPGVRVRDVDIVEVEVIENLIEDSIDFRITTVASPFNTGESNQPSLRHAWFHHGKQSFRIDFIPAANGNLAGQWELIETYFSGAHTWLNYTAGGDLRIDDNGRTLTASIPRLLLQEIAFVGPGMVIPDVLFEARRAVVAQACCGEDHQQQLPDYTDFYPNSPGLDVELTYGVESTPDLLIWSPSMIRGSNGGAMTIVFPMELTSKHDDVSIRVEGAPPSWNIATPIDSLDRPVEGLIIPVVITAEFAHQHGVIDFLTIVAEGGGETARAPVGIEYLEVPQPTGHHSTVWLHAMPVVTGNPLDAAFGTPHVLIMNAKQDDVRAAQDASVPGIRPNTTNPGPNNPGLNYHRDWSWTIPLDPPMKLGVDPILDGRGNLDFTLRSPVDGVSRITAAVEWIEGGEATSFFEGVTEMTVAVGENDVELRLNPTEQAGYRNNAGSSQLQLRITAETSIAMPDPQDQDMHLLGGGAMTLPLHEFSDSIVSVLPPSDVRFENERLQSDVQPDATYQRSVALVNDGNETQVVRLQAQGVQPLEITVDPAQMVLAPGERRTLDVTLHVPADAPRISHNAIVAVADAGHVAVVQWQVQVDDNAPPPIVQPKQKDAPGASMGAIMILLCVSVLLTSRRP